MQRSDKTQAGNATQTFDTLTTLQNIIVRTEGLQVMYQISMLFMQFTNETAGPLSHLKKKRKIYNTLEK